METDEKQPFGDDWKYAGFWVRMFASMVDSILIAFITVPLLIMIYGTQYFVGTDDPEVPVVWFEGPDEILIIDIFFIIVCILFWIYKSATPGKMVVHAKIVDAKTGQPPSAIRCIVRYFGYIISFLPLGMGFIWIAFDKKKQGWHDKLAGTVVIKPVHTMAEVKLIMIKKRQIWRDKWKGSGNIKPINTAAKIKSHSSGEES